MGKPFLLLFLLLVAAQGRAQLSHGGEPLQWANGTAPYIPVADHHLGPPDQGAALAAADTAGAPGGYRFGLRRAVGADMLAQGQWARMPGGGRVCRFTIQSDSAVMLAVQFDQFTLPWGGRLFLYDHARTTFLGGFTQANQQADGRFATAFLPGDAVTLEYQEPPGAPPATIRISHITHAWRSIFPPGAQASRDYYPGYPSSPCHNNVACPVAADWQDQSRAVLWFMTPEGYTCNGTLLNNTAQDGTPYVLIANHCYVPSESQWVFYFNYQSPTCIGDTGQTMQTLTGSVRRSILYHGDFCLMELFDTPPPAYKAYYAGWDRSGNTPLSGAAILNPLSDVKKISFYNVPAQSATLDEEQIPCWENYWFNGILEAGASGAPFFDENKRVVGHMVGGGMTCATATTDPVFAAKFSYNWNGGTNAGSRLRDWLDPSNTTMALDGFDSNGALPFVAVRPRAMLQGPFVQGTGNMSDALNSAGLLPLTEPYSGLGYVHAGTGGGETTDAEVLAVNGPLAVVDWVVVELRNKNAPAQVLASRSALLHRDGTITGVDGVSAVVFRAAAADNYYLAVRHRNHLGIMTAAPVALSTQAVLLDFTDGSVAVQGGSNATALVGGTRCMRAGDANGNGKVSYTGPVNDRDAVLVRVGGATVNASIPGYFREDTNMDGFTRYIGSGNDRDRILSTLGGLPTTVRNTALP